MTQRPKKGASSLGAANRPADADLRTLAAAIKSGGSCEQAHQRTQEGLGLDHFEGRSWTGLHRHALLTTIAFASLQHRLLVQSAGKRPLSRACTPPGKRSSQPL